MDGRAMTRSTGGAAKARASRNMPKRGVRRLRLEFWFLLWDRMSWCAYTGLEGRTDLRIMSGGDELGESA